jgi:hypothetical protein
MGGRRLVSIRARLGIAEAAVMQWKLIVSDLRDRLDAHTRVLTRVPGGVLERDWLWTQLRGQLSEAQQELRDNQHAVAHLRKAVNR